MPQERGAQVDKAFLEEACGAPLPAALWEVEPFGRRIICLREPPIKQTKGGLVIPEAAQRMPSVGWVVCAGSDVGTPTHVPQGSTTYSAEELVGKKVQWGAHVPQAFWVTDEGFESEPEVRRRFVEVYGNPDVTGFRAPFALMNDVDLWGLVP